MFRLVIPLIGGICAGIYLPWNLPQLFWVALGLLAIAGVLLLRTVFFNRYGRRFLFGTSCFVLLVVFGWALVKIHNPVNDGNHYTVPSEYRYFLAEVKTDPVEKDRSYKVVLQLLQQADSLNVLAASGNVIAYIAKEGFDTTLQISDKLLFQGYLQEIKPPQNPQQFDYKKFLANKKIYAQIYLTASRYVKLDQKHPFRLLQFFAEVREWGVNRFKTMGFSGAELAVVSALVLGVKDHLTEDVTQAFAGTGAMHVLAVSGLHVGVVYLLIYFLLNHIFAKRGVRLKALLSVVILILYAGITGFSPSVLRASTMFAFIAIAAAFKEQTSIYNTLAASAVILLLINPLLITQVGFQLSYLAVLGIVYIQPKIRNLLYIRNKLLRKIWELSAVAISAQIATFPLSLYYFNQFPNYFLLANLVVIPLAFLILYGGLAVLLLGWIPFVGSALAFVVRELVKFLNSSVLFMSELPFAVNNNISLSVVGVLLLYMILLFAFTFIERPTINKWRMLGIGICCFLAVSANRTIRVNKQKEIVFYQVNNETAIDLIYGRQHFFICSDDLRADEATREFCITPAWITKKLFPPVFISSDSTAPYRSNELYATQNHLVFCGTHLKLSSTAEDWQGRCDILILRDTIWMNAPIVKYIANKNVQQVIIDGSVPYYVEEKYLELADSLNLSVWSTQEKGFLCVGL